MSRPSSPSQPAVPTSAVATSLSPEHAGGQPEEHRVFIKPGFRWDGQDAYLFDIDGTLLRSRDRVHYDAFFAAVDHVLGRPLVLDGVTLHGNTDPGILRDAFQLGAMEDASWRPHVPAIFLQMSERVTLHQSEMDLLVMPGVPEVLAHLQRKGAALGVATGNIESIGWIKVTVAGLRDWFTFGGFSDAFENRSEMIAHALGLARERTGPGSSVCVVGDTTFDVTAARANGLPTIAVATGNYTFDELMEARPEVCATSLQALLNYAPAEAV